MLLFVPSLEEVLKLLVIKGIPGVVETGNNTSEDADIGVKHSAVTKAEVYNIQNGEHQPKIHFA
jgi:hypothetical protein